MERKYGMVELQWKVEGRRFRSQEEYMAAKRDKELIDSITANLRLDKPQDIEKLYMELKRGKYQFESIVGRQFDDNVYELYKQIKEEERQRIELEQQRKERKRKEKEQRRQVFKAKLSKQTERIRFDELDKEMQKEVIQQLKRKERKKKLVVAICIPVCTICFGYFLFYYQEVLKSNAEIAELIALKETTAAEYSNEYLAGNQVIINRTQKEDTEAPDILAEYKNLHNKNKKLIGWIKIDDTIIDYPVMQTVNNEYYLNHNFNQEEDRNGCIFMDYQCDVIKGCDNMILYGHHMQSGKMFGTLNKYSSESYYEEHPKIQFDTIYEKGQYEIMYVFRSKVFSEEEITFKYYQFINAGSEQEFNSYMNEMAALSLYDTGVTAAYGDQLLTLSTCDYQENDGRFVVVAKRVN